MLASLSCISHRRSVCVDQFMCLHASPLANLVDRIPRATIKLVESLQRQGFVFSRFRVNALLELLTQEFELVGLQAGDGCWRGEER